MDAKLTKAQVLTTLQAKRRAWDALLVEVGDARMGQVLPGGRWSPKDLLARGAWYEQELAAVLAAAPLPPQRAWLWALPADQRNAIVDREQRAGSVAAGRAAAQAAFTYLVAVVAALDAGAGQDGTRFPTMPASRSGGCRSGRGCSPGRSGAGADRPGAARRRAAGSRERQPRRITPK
jgi:hypothetical protein